MWSDKKKPSLKEFISYYSTTPWVALLRYLEVELTREVASLCASPILDLGCGDGFVAKQAFQDKLFAGIDLDLSVLKLAKSKGAFRHMINGNARSLPFHSNFFETVFSNGAVEHMVELDEVLKEIYRVLRPGGIFLALVPSNRLLDPVGNITKVMGKKVWKAYNKLQNHVNLLSPEQWHSQLELSCFDTKLIQAYGDRNLARMVATYDLVSKVHLLLRRPYLTLTHGGNIGRVVLRLVIALCQMPKEVRISHTQNPDGYWLAIAAVRN